MAVRQKITTYLWFDDDAEEAVNHYLAIFPDGKILNESRYTEAGPGPAGSLMLATFQLAGQEFMALNGGPQFRFNEAVSLLVSCETQDEVDHYWQRLGEGGEHQMCGWLKDRFGLSWQIVPTALGELMAAADAGQGRRVMQAMLQMRKLDIAGLRRAAAGE